MNRFVSAIGGRLSLRSPQRRSLEILDRITEVVSLKKGADRDAAPPHLPYQAYLPYPALGRSKLRPY